MNEVSRDIFNAATQALEATMREASNFQKSSDSGLVQPPAKKGEGNRRAHPGGWATVSGNLRDSILANPVVMRGSTLSADLSTNMEYAEKLDGKKRKNGGYYYVLTGLDKDFDFQQSFDKFLGAKL